MPQIILGPGLEKVDGSLQKATYGVPAKLTEDDTLPGLHIEPMHNSADPRARTGRVDLFYRAVLFKVQGSQDEASYVYIGTYPHDEAIDDRPQVAAQHQPPQRRRRTDPGRRVAPASRVTRAAGTAPAASTDGRGRAQSARTPVHRRRLDRPGHRRDLRRRCPRPRRRRCAHRVRRRRTGSLAGQRTAGSLYR